MMANYFEDFYWVYVLESLKNGNKYTGYTKNLLSVGGMVSCRFGI
ncbi:MAG: hypothetical protein IEMM0006_1592 [bacterium]|nr:MAG: hypothetical protein IEMM0006_1592 [bacterium]